MKKVELEAQRSKTPSEAKAGRKRRNPVEDLKREVAIMRTLRHKNIVSLQVRFLELSLCEHSSISSQATVTSGIACRLLQMGTFTYAVHEDHGFLAPVPSHMPPCVALTVQLPKVWGSIVLKAGTVLPDI